MSVYDEIRAEREHQDAKWGGPMHDDDHDEFDWLSYLDEHLGKARNAHETGTYRRQLVRVAALAVAAVESFDRLWPQPPAAGTGEGT